MGNGFRGFSHQLIHLFTEADEPATTEAIIIPGLAGSPDKRGIGAYDNEFDLPLSGWGIIGSLDVANADTDVKSHLHIKKTTSGNRIDGIYQTSPSLPFTMTVKLSDLLSKANYNQAGIMIGEAAPGKLDTFGLPFDTSATMRRFLQRQTWTNNTTRTGNVNYDFTALFPPFYLRITVNSSTNVDYLWSFGGLIYQAAASAVNPGFTVGSVGLYVNDFNGGSPEAYFDWIRFT